MAEKVPGSIPNKSEPAKPEFRIERKNGVSTIETPLATYKVIFHNHSTPVKSDSIPITTKAMFLEVEANWTNPEIDWYKFSGSITPYKNIGKILKDNNIPIYLGDPSMPMGTDFFDLFVEINEIILGLKLLEKTKKMSRRNFLKMIGTAGLGAYFMSPIVGESLNAMSDVTNTNNTIFSNIEKKNYKIHPEVKIFVLKFRNSVIAYKEQYIAKLMNNKPVISTILGPGHREIENNLQSSQTENLEYIRKYKPLLHKIVDIPETFYSIHVNYPNGQSETLVVPELKKLWES